MPSFSIRNFERYQHYRDRKPPWVKLYRDLWRDRNFFRLSERAKLLYIGLITVASITDNKIPDDPAWVAAELALSEKTIDFEPLLRAGFLYVAGETPTAHEAPSRPWASRYIPEDLRADVLKRDHHECRECHSKENLEIDHVIPVSKLPPDWTPTLDALQTLCRSCNRRKRTRSSAEQPATQTSQTSEQLVILETETDQRRDREEDPSDLVRSEADPLGDDQRLTPEDLREAWNEFCVPVGLSQVATISDSRRKKCQLRLREHPEIEFWQKLFGKIRGSPFLMGLTQNGNSNGHEKWRASFDWLIENDTNCLKIYEGRYAPENKNPPRYYNTAAVR